MVPVRSLLTLSSPSKLTLARNSAMRFTVYSQEQWTDPTGDAPPGPAAAGQSSAWLAYRQGPVERQRCLQKGPGCFLGPAWTGQKGAGGVRHPMTCADSGQVCPEPASAAAKELTHGQPLDGGLGVAHDMGGTAAQHARSRAADFVIIARALWLLRRSLCLDRGSEQNLFQTAALIRWGHAQPLSFEPKPAGPRGEALLQWGRLAKPLVRKLVGPGEWGGLQRYRQSDVCCHQQGYLQQVLL
ncbi:MAG: hypothetical protein FRX49_04624 [Trebouxia sp. A1-2]|nr:MAG: hypothetical protein FRX49_04624 [Trebouxia sp. A1-2]